MHASYYMCNPDQNWLITLHIFKNDNKTSYMANIQYNHVKIYSLKDVHSGGKNQKPIQNNHIWLVVVLWRCFLRQLPVQNNHFRVVPRVVVLHRFAVLSLFSYKSVQSKTKDLPWTKKMTSQKSTCYKWITNTVLENGLILGRCICNYFFYGNHL